MITRTGRFLRLALLVAVFLASASLASAYTITLNSDPAFRELVTRAHDVSTPGGAADDRAYPATLPFSDTTIAVEGGSSAESVYDLSSAGFNITFDHSRDAGDLDYAQSYGILHFSVDQDVNYSARGLYSTVDPDGGFVVLYAYVVDITGSSTMFESHQHSDSTPNESFTLGGSGGDRGSTNTGSLTGTMIAGREYEFFYNAYIEASPSTSGATASGYVSLNFTPIPEPSAAALLGLGLVGLTLAGRKRTNL